MFEDQLEIESQTVPIWLNPIRSVSWILRTWSSALEGGLEKEFLDMRVRDFLVPNDELEALDVAAELDPEVAEQIAAWTWIRARKR